MDHIRVLHYEAQCIEVKVFSYVFSIFWCKVPAASKPLPDHTGNDLFCVLCCSSKSEDFKDGRKATVRGSSSISVNLLPNLQLLHSMKPLLIIVHRLRTASL